MRLVDLDSKDFENHLETGGKEFARGIRFVWDVLNEQPIVDAIPVDWLKKHSWYGVIKHWEKDQKLNNSKEVLYSLLKDHGFNSYGEYINWAEAIMAIPRDDKVKIWQEEMENGTKTD